MSSVNATTLRLTGMNSGLDTDSIVKSLLEIDQLKVDNQFKAKTKLEWTGDAYREVNSKLRTFREKYMSVLNQSTNMYSESAYKAYSVSMQTTTSAVTISAGSSATEGAMTINSITQLAKAAQIPGTRLTNTATAYTTLKEALGEEAFDENGNISFSINGEEFTFGEDITISSMISTINSNANAGVTMSFSSLKNAFSIVGKNTGYDNTIEIENISGNAFAENASEAAFQIAEGTVRGQNAKVKIEGVDVEKSTNSFTIDGITYTLKGESSTAIAFNVERNVDEVYNKIASFVDAYNSLIEELQGKLDEKIYKEYDPLTDTEREDLTTEQADQWDEKAKSGLLQNDSGIRNLLQTMRNAFYQAVGETGKSAASLGLKTAAYATTGKIVIDEEKLRAAINSNPDEVAKIFISTSKSTDSATKNSESGLIARLANTINGYVENSVTNTLDNNSKAIKNSTEKLDDLEDWLAANEEKYWSKFTAMESALSKMNSQTSYLSSLLASLG